MIQLAPNASMMVTSSIVHTLAQLTVVLMAVLLAAVVLSARVVALATTCLILSVHCVPSIVLPAVAQDPALSAILDFTFSKVRVYPPVRVVFTALLVFAQTVKTKTVESAPMAHLAFHANLFFS